MAIVASDDFTGTDSGTGVWNNGTGVGRMSPVGAKEWRGTPATTPWPLVGNRAGRSATGANNDAWCVINSGLSDCTFEVDFTTGATLSNNGITFRWADASNFLQLVDDGGGWVLQRCVAGARNNVAQAGTCAPSTTYHLRVVMSGTSVKIYVGAALVHDRVITDPVLLSATRHGMSAWIRTDYWWDNISVASIVVPTAPGVPTAVGVDTVTDTTARLHWAAPATGDPPTDYEVRITPA